MNWILVYLLIGLCNAVQFQLRGPWYFEWQEAVFNLFFWPLQILFRVFVLLVSAGEAVLGWVFR